MINRPNRALAAVMIAILLGASEVRAELFSFVDDAGRTHYVDSKEKVPEQYRSQLDSAKPMPEISKVKPGREKLYEKDRYEAAAPSARSEVEIFVTDWCPYCKTLEADLRAAGIKYQRYNVEQDRKAMAEYQKIGAGGFPLTRVNGTQIVRGANVGAIKQALSNSRKRRDPGVKLTAS